MFSLYVGVSAYDPCPQIRHFKDKLSLWMCDDADTLFFKPSRGSQSDSHFVSSSLSNLDSIMSAYKALSLVPLSFEYMLYPVGIMTLNDAAIRPSTNIVQFVNQCLASDFPDDAFPVGSPLLMFDRLDSSWTNEKPSDHLGASYTANITKAASILKDAKVAHLDLRPSNIMWKETEGNNVCIRIIDLESFAFFGDLISPPAVKAYAADTRYPFIADDTIYDNSSVTEDIYEFGWTFIHDTAIAQLKILLASPPILKVFDNTLETSITTDGSIKGVGAVLQQLHPDGWHPVFYMSKKLSDVQSRWATSQFELYAIILALDR